MNKKDLTTLENHFESVPTFMTPKSYLNEDSTNIVVGKNHFHLGDEKPTEKGMAKVAKSWATKVYKNLPTGYTVASYGFKKGNNDNWELQALVITE